MLLDGLGGSVDVAQTGYGTTNKSTPYSDMLRENQLPLPHSDVMNTAVETENQASNHSDQIRYQELERKFLDGSIKEYEFDELQRLDNIRRLFDVPRERVSRIREKNITRAEWDNWQDNYAAAKFFGVSGTGNLSSIVKRSTIKTQGGFECFPDGDPLKRNIQNVQPINNYFDVAMHGTPDAVCFGGTERNMTARVLASVIRHSGGWNGQNVRLLSCSTGKSEGDSLCFAEELANALGVTVLAPNLDLYIFPSGTFQVGEFGEGAFVEYKPNERRRLK